MNGCFTVKLFSHTRSAGVAPEVYLRITLYSSDKARKGGIHPGFETKGSCNHKSKTGESVAPSKGLMPSKILQKTEKKLLSHSVNQALVANEHLSSRTSFQLKHEFLDTSDS